MTVRRTANVALTLAQVGRLLGLPESQRVFNVYFEPQAAIVVVQIEGGDELPLWDDMPPDAGQHGFESPFVRVDNIPAP